MPETSHCPECGKPTPQGLAEGGLCPDCLLSLALTPREETATAEAPLDSLYQAGDTGVRFHYFGDYELLEEISRGGMGVVYMAHQISLNRPVAIKLILGEKLASEDVKRRFQVEAEAAASLDHPNIVPIYETGEHEGHPYLSMKLVEGKNLADVLRDGGFKEPASATMPQLLAKVARAVHYAHSRGIVHRDLKPSNILIDQETCEPFVTDFGLAKFVDAADRDLTRSAAMLGTPHYMSPEQCRGGSASVTTASDIYALGVMLYEVLAGQPPFEGESTLEVIRKISDDEPPRFHNLNVSRDLETICRKCLEKEPAQRYASALSLAEDLERFDRGEPVHARPVSVAERGLRWCKRNKALTGLLTATAFAVVLGFFGFVKVRREAEEARTSHARNYALRMTQAWFDYHNGNLGKARRALEATRPKPGQEDRREWEWRMLWGLVHSPHEDVFGKLGGLGGEVAFSADGERLFATAGKLHNPDRVEIWNVAHRHCESVYQPANVEIRGLCAERELVAVVKETVIEVHRFTSGDVIAAIPISPFEWSRKAHFSQDGRYLVIPLVDKREILEMEEIEALEAEGHEAALSNRDVRIAIIDINDSRIVYDEIRPRKPRVSRAGSVRLSPDGRLLVTAMPQAGVQVIDWRTGEVVFHEAESRLYQNADVLCAAFSPDGQMLALGGAWGPHPVWLIDLATGARSRLLSETEYSRRARGTLIQRNSGDPLPGGRDVRQLAFSKDGSQVAAFGDYHVEVWETANGDRSHAMLFGEGVTRGAFSPDGLSIMGASVNHETLSPHPMNPEREIKRLTGPMRSATVGIGNFLTDSPFTVATLIDEAVLSEYEGTLLEGSVGVPALIDLKTLEVIEKLEVLGNNHIRSILLPGDRALAAPRGGGLKMLDLNSRNVTDIETQSGQAVPIVVIRKLNAVMIGYAKGGRPWELRDLETLEVIQEGTGAWSLPVNFTADEEFVVCPWADHNLFPLRKVAMNSTFLSGNPKDDHYPVDVVKTHDGRLLGLWDGKIWDARRNEIILDQSNSALSASEAMFLPGGKRLLSVGRTLWDLEIESPVMWRGLEWRGSVIGLLDISPDGNVIMVHAADGPNNHYLHLWRAPSWEEIEAAEAD